MDNNSQVLLDDIELRLKWLYTYDQVMRMKFIPKDDKRRALRGRLECASFLARHGVTDICWSLPIVSFNWRGCKYNLCCEV